MSSFFKSSKHVRELSPADFDPMQVWQLRDKECTAVLFYAPWCGHCQQIKGTWEEFGRTAKFCNVAAFDTVVHKDHLMKINESLPHLIKGFPTIVFYKRGEPGTAYTGERTATGLLEFGMRECSGRD